MSLPVSGQVGPQVLSDGAVAPVREGKGGDVIISELNARYFEQVYRANTFSACAQSALTFPAGLTSTSPVFTLFNPSGSGKNLVILDIELALSAAPAAATVFAVVANNNPLQTAPSSVTAISSVNNLIGNKSQAAGQAYSVATLIAAPVVVRPIGSVVAASSITPNIQKDEVAGALIVAPGCSISVAASAAASGFVNVTWAEVAI